MGRVVHFEIHAGDCDRAERFYSAVFGWKVERFEGGSVDYRLLNTGPSGAAGIDGAIVERREDLDGRPGGGFVCTIGVDDIEATEKAVADAGGEQVVDRREVEGVGRVSYFKDTEGNVFGALQPEQGGP